MYEKSGYDDKPAIMRVSNDLLQLSIIILIGLALSGVFFGVFLVFKKMFIRKVLVRVMNLTLLVVPL